MVPVHRIKGSCASCRACRTDRRSDACLSETRLEHAVETAVIIVVSASAVPIFSRIASFSKPPYCAWTCWRSRTFSPCSEAEPVTLFHRATSPVFATGSKPPQRQGKIPVPNRTIACPVRTR